MHIPKAQSTTVVCANSSNALTTAISHTLGTPYKCVKAWERYLSISDSSIACSAASLAAVTAACCSSDSFRASALAAEILAATAWRASLSLPALCTLGSAPLLLVLGLLWVSTFAVDLHGICSFAPHPMR